MSFFSKKVYSSFKDNIWGADLANMQLIGKFSKGICFLSCVIDIYSKYAWVIPLKGYSLNKSDHKPNKIWVDKGSEFYNRSMKSWLEKNDIEMYSTHNEEKSVDAERYIRTLKNKTYKYVTSISKNMSINTLADIVNNYNNTYHSTVKMKPTH